MKYLYKQTGMVVESSVALDSLLFEPVKKNAEPQKQTETETKKTAEPAKKTTQKTTTKTTVKTTKK